MDKITRKDVEKTTIADIAETSTAAALSLIPGVGELFNRLVMPFAERRRNDWIESIENRLKELQSKYPDIDKLLTDNEKAISAILYASPLALKTNNHTKLTALQNIIINTILEPNYEEYKIQMFLRFVDDFSELHILLLKFLNEPGLFYKPKDTCFTYSIASYSLESLFLKQYKGFDSSSVKSALNYLTTNYLIDCEITTFSTVMTTDALLISRTTNLGKDFIEFIISK